MAIGFGNGGNLTIPSWSASFQSVQPFTLQAAVGDITSIDSGNGVLRKQIGSGRHQIQPQTASFFFDPELGETTNLTDGSVIADAIVLYPSGTNKNRKGNIYVTGYTDGGLIDDEIMVGEVTILWEGGVTLAAMTDQTP